MDLKEMKSLLKEIEAITFSKHFSEPKVALRGLSREEIEGTLRDTEHLEIVVAQGEKESWHKYALLFHKSSKYDLKIVISVRDKALNVVTAHIQNKKRRKVLDKWLKSLA